MRDPPTHSQDVSANAAGVLSPVKRQRDPMAQEDGTCNWAPAVTVTELEQEDRTLNRIALVSFAVASLVGLPTVASAHPLPPGWTELTCVVLDSRPMLIDIATGREVTSSATGVYTVGPYSAKILNGELVDASTGIALPTAGGAVVDQVGHPIVMLSSWSRIACPPGVQLGPIGLQGVAGATGATGAPGAVSVGPQGPQGVPGTIPAVRIAALVPKVVKPKPKATPHKKKARKVKAVRQIAVVG